MMRVFLAVVAVLLAPLLWAEDFYKRPDGPAPNHFVPIARAWSEGIPEVLRPGRHELGFFAALPSFGAHCSLAIYEDYEYIDLTSKSQDGFESFFDSHERKKCRTDFIYR